MGYSTPPYDDEPSLKDCLAVYASMAAIFVLVGYVLPRIALWIKMNWF